MSFREAPLTGTMLAALVPADLDLNVTMVDGSVSPIPLDTPFDLVAISLITGMALKAYALADHYRHTPFPNPPAYHRLKQEGRILHENWTYDDTQHVVIRPKHMSPAELDQGFIRAWRNSFKTTSCLRHFRWHKNTRITAVGNLAYRLYGHQLKHDQNRFPDHPAVY